MNYIEETLKFIESDEMREYLYPLFAAEKNKTLLRSKCAEIVSHAPAQIERKIPVLDLIAAQTEPNPEGDCHDPVKLAALARFALGEAQNASAGAVFQVREFIFHKNGYYNDYTMYHEFEAALQYIKWIDKQEDNVPEIHKNANYLIGKYIPGEIGKMVCVFHWILNATGEIWYFGDEVDHWKSEFYNYLGDMNLPVPFEPGDIVTADCRPFAETRQVLIIGTGDNHDCCAVQCIYSAPDKKLAACAFKHNSFLRSKEEISHVSVLYRAKRHKGMLAEAEAPFEIISTCIKSNPKLAEQIIDYFHNEKTPARMDDEGNIIEHRGVKWEDLKNEFAM